LRKCVATLALILAVVSSPVANSGVTAVNTSENRCLASVIFWEARGEPLAGRRAVLDVVQHRMEASGKSACAVVKERAQFSWYPRKPILPLTYELNEMLTEVKTSGKVLINEKFFYSGKKKPSWARKMFCRKIFNHNFCNPKEKN
jgi:spore germination cell wall hydrolase CwlJ-like protein